MMNERISDIGYLFDDEDMRRFIVDGYVVVKADLPGHFHDDIHRRTEEMFTSHGNLGNNILPLIPEIGRVFGHPAVRGALTSILGPNYVMHSHRYCHRNQPGSQGQDFHKDSYEGDVQVTHHPCRWAMAFYYPQNTPANMGPSAILPRSQYYDDSDAAHAMPEMPVYGEAGTVAIIHYDLWHRACPNVSDRLRYMIKFLFERMSEPTRPAWRNAEPRWVAPSGEAGQHQAMYEALWHWNRGQANVAVSNTSSINGSVDAQVTRLFEGDEPDRLDAAYGLGLHRSKALPALMETLRANSDGVSKHAAYGLSAIGHDAVPALTKALTDGGARTRANAAYALANLGRAAWAELNHTNPGIERVTATTLASVLVDDTNSVRRNAAEALGTLRVNVPEAITGLGELLSDEEYWVRDNAARALCKMGHDAEGALDALVTALGDEDRYVRFHAGLALRQIGTAAAEKVLFDTLSAERWCPLTTTLDPF